MAGYAKSAVACKDDVDLRDLFAYDIRRLARSRI